MVIKDERPLGGCQERLGFDSSTILLTVGFVVAAFVALFYNLGACRTLGSHEVLAAVPAREMLTSGDWIVPHYSGIPRLKKPPLCYWAIAAAGAVFGGVSEWTARLPAAVSAVALAVLIGVWTARWFGTRSGWAAAFVQLTPVYVLTYGRKAEVDMLLLLLIVAAMFLAADQPDEESRRRATLRWAIIWSLAGVSWLAKFHFGPVMIFAPYVVFQLVQRRFRLRQFVNPLGWIAFAVCLAVWPLWVLNRLPSAADVWRQETIGRALGSLGSSEPVWFYFPAVLSLMLPWTIPALIAVPASWRKAWKEGCPRERFLWCWLLTQLAIVSLSADKHVHYAMPALPVLSILSGRTLLALLAYAGSGIPWLRAWHCVTVTLVAVGGTACGCLYLSARWPYLTAVTCPLAVTIGAGVALVVWLLLSRRPRAAGWTVVAVWLACNIGVNGWILPGRDHRAPAAHFGESIRSNLPRQEVLVYRTQYQHGDFHPIVFYLGEPVTGLPSSAAIREHLSRKQRCLVVADEATVGELAQIGRAERLAELNSPPNGPRHKGPRLVLIELTAAVPFLPTGSPSEAKPGTDTAARNFGTPR